MSEEEFIETVREEAPFESTDLARNVGRAVLATLGERITDGAATDLARHLPDGPAEPLRDAPGEAEQFPFDEFTAQVSDRADLEDSEVVPCARAVITALDDATAGELATAREQLPPAFDVVFAPGGPDTADEFLATVRERSDADSRRAAREATRATLRTLGERLSGGEAEDLAHYAPDPLDEPLTAASGERGAPYALAEFYGRVARRADVDEATAETRARAVGGTLAERASDREVDAARKQLPDPFGVVFEPPAAPSEGA